MIKARLFIALFVAPIALAQDQDWVRDWARAQQQRPASISSVGRIAPPGEPGIPMVIHGQIEPARAGVIVFAYQTDATGVYNARGMRGWRLQGWARSDANGRFEFRTIRPASYPGQRFAAHIHVTVEGPNLSRRWVNEIEFADDPLLANKANGLPVTTRNGIQHVNYKIAIRDTGTF